MSWIKENNTSHTHVLSNTQRSGFKVTHARPYVTSIIATRLTTLTHSEAILTLECLESSTFLSVTIATVIAWKNAARKQTREKQLREHRTLHFCESEVE